VQTVFWEGQAKCRPCLDHRRRRTSRVTTLDITLLGMRAVWRPVSYRDVRHWLVSSCRHSDWPNRSFASVGKYQPSPLNITGERSPRSKSHSKWTCVAMRHLPTERDKWFRYFSSSLSSCRIYWLQTCSIEHNCNTTHSELPKVDTLEHKPSAQYLSFSTQTLMCHTQTGFICFYP
jgi:hypothetical protein